MKLSIERVDNGFILRLPPEGEAPEHVEVFEYKGTSGSPSHVEAWVRCLYAVDGAIGPETGRFSPARVYFEVKRGDKFEDDVP